LSSIFSAAVTGLLAGDTVMWCFGATFSFASATKSVWQGVGSLDATTFSGPIFDGLGNLGTIDIVEVGVQSATRSVIFTLSGVDASLFSTALAQAAEVQGRRAKIYMLFFDGSGSLLGCALRRTVVMDKITVAGDMTDAGPTLTLQLSSEPILGPKNGRPWSLLNHADQLARYPSDNALERVTNLSGKQTLLWITTST
jgi:hypothetical protein